ncbi:hypothetical protein WH96_05610 [Kiloniella spongiae]|uniref:Ketopantoate reductase N-terminal domain-containing protein n=2 Tax=Kiloniella spongiae TaxID=1489064 RepID=A0A0H2MHU4_9PROT|nr:hypothetical protein WH96_05610 [Kiloniella spongiae]
MLSAAGLWLAEHSEQTTIISRNPAPFVNQLRDQGYQAKGTSCNYKIPQQRQNLSKTLNPNKYDLILLWIHQDGASLLEELSTSCCSDIARIIWVVGSDFQNLEKEHANKKFERSTLPDNVSLQIVILGFQVELGKSRWLSHQEISQGVIRVIKAPQEKESTIGQTESLLAPNQDK